MSTFLKKLFVFIVIIVLLVAFFSSGKSYNVDNLAVVLAMAIDTSTNNNIKVTFQFTNASSFSQSGSTEKTESIKYTIEASSISSAMNLMNTNIGKELTMSHCKLIVFSEEIAKDDITKEIYTLVNDPQVRPSTNIIISKTSAIYYLENAKPLLENLLTRYYESMTNPSEYTGYTANATIGSFFNSLICDSCEPYAILGGISNEKGQDSTAINEEKDYSGKSNNSALTGQTTSENIGLAVFKGGQLVGELNALETMSFLATRNKVKGFLVTIPNPNQVEKYLDIYLIPTALAKVDVKIVNGSPYIKIDYKFKGKIQSMDPDSNYLDPNLLSSISYSCSKYLESTFSNYLYKTSKDLQSDINGFGKNALKNFFTIQEFEDFNWNEKYKDAFFEVKVDTNITSSALLTET